jgi:hypothetical protein
MTAFHNWKQPIAADRQRGKKQFRKRFSAAALPLRRNYSAPARPRNAHYEYFADRFEAGVHGYCLFTLRGTSNGTMIPQ